MVNKSFSGVNKFVGLNINCSSVERLSTSLVSMFATLGGTQFADALLIFRLFNFRRFNWPTSLRNISE